MNTPPEHTPLVRTAEDTRRTLLELEERHDLFRLEVDGASAWQVLRFKVTNALRGSWCAGLSTGPRYTRRELYTRALRDIPALLFPKRAEVFVRTLTNALTVRHGELFEDVKFDALLRRCPSWFKLEGLTSKQHAWRRKHAALPINATDIALHLMSDRLVRLRPSPQAEAVAKHIAPLLSGTPGLESFTRERIANQLNHFHWLVRLHTWLLRRVRPRLVLAASSQEAYLFHAARRIGTASALLQHGWLNRYHSEVMPPTVGAHRDLYVRPDWILVWGEHWREQMLEYGPYDPDEVVAIGSPRIDAARPEAEAGKEGRDAIEVVFVSQGVEVERAADLLKDFLQRAGKAGTRVRLCVKLHPGYDTEQSALRYEALSRHGEVVVAQPDDPQTTQKLIAAADLHVSISSSSHYEALGLGTPTVVLALPSHEPLLHLVEAGDARLAATAEELYAAAIDPAFRTVDKERAARYFTPGAVESMLRLFGLDDALSAQ